MKSDALSEHARATLRARVRELTAVLVETPTPSGNEAALYPFLTAVLQACGFHVERQMTSLGRENLVARRGRSTLLFSAHVDTYPAYTHPEPYRLREENGRLIGRGAVDCKGQIAALLCAVELMDAPCQIAFVVDEERTALGSREVQIEADGVIVLEPTELRPVVAHAGAIELEVAVYGRAAHGSMPHCGENAVLKAMRVIEEIARLPFLEQTHPLFPPAPWVTLGKIEGGFDTMVVPNRCTFQMDVRVLPGVSIRTACEQLFALAAQYGAELTILDVSEPSEVDAQHPVVRALMAAHEAITGERPTPCGYYSFTDATHYLQRGFPAIVYGAGNLGVAHSDHEWVSLDELEIMTRVLAHMLAHWG
ncbi:MAG: M20/M25/M40 family metallo-hydrolase [Blastocatellia bacterium]|nr:M20/M25/M40 family metallo-hydrolase [Blastocatellia bacterium]MCS7158489.1 M20/M25/M40 family metallo-hydrolase [Blastocatellia bacterium]MCX7753440.1 M20/M25/M40 family metallo-hydrolase [Blastocatellia bacterium]MDW8167830.1 M20/M25/M40 family metallo-hydrolase [Acidobacteriota bacterium]MDW8255865.1 M20/M25/M40 family metallo-hydrolase [Acidobacteriota bacterium]